MHHSYEGQKTPKDWRKLSRNAFAATLLIIVVIVLAIAVTLGTRIDESFTKAGSDQLLRLVLIRNWMGGQSWFDTTVYRMMPPEGVLMHWSRYIDALIGVLIWVLSAIVPVARAEMLAAVIWPTLLQVAVIAVIGFGAKRLFGPIAACFAMLWAFSWPFTAQFYFRPGNIDHHNVQILMIVVMTQAAVWPDQPARSGTVAGITAGFALAVGLETLPYILVLGLMLFARATLGLSNIADRLLVVFCIALSVSAVAFWLGQTPGDRLMYPFCDQLGLPVLALIAIAAAASVMPIAIGLLNIFLRLAASVLIVVVGCLMAWPMLSVCIAGPYSALPVGVQEIIRSFIIEALPGLEFATRRPLLYFEIMLPVAATLAVAGMLWSATGKQSKADRTARDFVGQLLFLSTIGIIASFSQIRLTLMAAGALPLLAGYSMATLLSLYLAQLRIKFAVMLMLGGLAVLAPPMITTALAPLLPASAPTRSELDSNCREKPAMMAVNALPPAVFLPTMNLSSLMLLTTHHSVLSGPYHRSPDAFANGKIPFGLPEADMRAYVDRIGVDYLLLCEGSNYGEGYATILAEGGSSAWLRRIELESGPIMVFEVLREVGA